MLNQNVDTYNIYEYLGFHVVRKDQDLFLYLPFTID